MCITIVIIVILVIILVIIIIISISHRLPDGVGTICFYSEVPRVPYISQYLFSSAHIFAAPSRECLLWGSAALW